MTLLRGAVSFKTQDTGAVQRVLVHTLDFSCADANYVVTRLGFGLYLQGVKNLENSEWW